MKFPSSSFLPTLLCLVWQSFWSSLFLTLVLLLGCGSCVQNRAARHVYISLASRRRWRRSCFGGLVDDVAAVEVEVLVWRYDRRLDGRRRPIRVLLLYERHDPGHLRCHHRTMEVEVEVPLWKLKVDPDISVVWGPTLNGNAVKMFMPRVSRPALEYRWSMDNMSTSSLIDRSVAANMT